jgi:hypothetical protein
MNLDFFPHEAPAAKKQAKEENKRKWFEPKKKCKTAKQKRFYSNF